MDRFGRIIAPLAAAGFLLCSPGCKSGRTIEAFPNSYSGVGMELTMDQGRPVVVGTIEGSPAMAAGVKQGEVLVAVDGESTKGMTLAEVVDRIRGPTGTMVRLTLEGPSGSRTLSLKRGKLERKDHRSQSGGSYQAAGGPGKSPEESGH